MLRGRRLLFLIATVAVVTSVPAGSLAQGGSQDSGADGESDVVTFYGHVFGHGVGAPMPSNTEAPIGENNYGLGFIGGCGPSATPGGLSCEDDTSKRLVLFSTPGFVDVEGPADWEAGGGYSLLHNERGQTQDVQLDTSQNMEATIFMTADFHGWPVSTVNGEGTLCAYPHPEDVPCVYPYWGWDVGTHPNAVVEATLYHAQLGDHGANASDAPPIADAIPDAEVVAHGQWSGQMVNGLPGTPTANEITVDMGTPEIDTIPRDHDWFVDYHWYQSAGGTDYGTHSWRLFAGEFFPPSYTIPVENAFSVESVIPTFAHGQLAILGIMNTPWGSYDLQPGSVDLTVEGPNGEVTPERIDRRGQFSVAHGGHYQPINFTWIWDYQAEDLPTGEYTVTVSASNFQGSSSAACSATFTLNQEGEQFVPNQIDPGRCGAQTLSEERAQQLQEGAADEAGG